MHREVNLTKRIRTSAGLRYCPVVLSANGSVKPDAVLVNGKPELHPEGAYYIEWHGDGKRIRLSVGKDPADAGGLYDGLELLHRFLPQVESRRR
jgi:hypothetical protein